MIGTSTSLVTLSARTCLQMKKLKHKFVEFMPRPLEDGVLYVSIRFRIVSHNCCCGCGNEVVLNLSPNGWQLTFDGESISLYPSIGNWNFACRSHYWITRNKVRWADSWSDERIRRARKLENSSDSRDTSDVSPEKRKRRFDVKKGIWEKIKSKTGGVRKDTEIPSD